MAGRAQGLTVSNRTGGEVRLLWSDGTDETHYLSVPPQEVRTQLSFSEHTWRCRAEDGNLLCSLTLGTSSVAVTLGDGVASSGPGGDIAATSIVVAVSNRTGGEVRLLWSDGTDETHYLSVPPQEVRTQLSFSEHTWRCRAEDGNLLCSLTLGTSSVAVTLGDGVASSGLEADSSSATEIDRSAAAFYHHCEEVGTAGIVVRAHASVSAAAVHAASDILRGMLRGSPPHVLERLQAAHCSVAIIGRAQLTSDVPEHAFLSGALKGGDWEYDATTRGLAGNPACPVTSVGEENLVDDESDGGDDDDGGHEGGVHEGGVHEGGVHEGSVGSAPPPPSREVHPEEGSSGDEEQPMAVDRCHPVADESMAPSEADAESSSTAAEARPTTSPPSDPAAEVVCRCACCGAPAPSPEIRLRARRRRDLYPQESILVHEFSHTVMDVGLDEPARTRIRAAHAAALERGLVDRKSYMGSNPCARTVDPTHPAPPHCSHTRSHSLSDATRARRSCSSAPRCVHSISLRARPCAACGLASCSSEYWAEAAQAWFHASMRCDVNCGINTRDQIMERDPGVAEELCRAFGGPPAAVGSTSAAGDDIWSNDAVAGRLPTWLYPQHLATAAPRRAVAWASLDIKRDRVRTSREYRLLVPLCQCARRHQGLASSPTSVIEGANVSRKQWRVGQPLCTLCDSVVDAARTRGLK